MIRIALQYDEIINYITFMNGSLFIQDFSIFNNSDQSMESIKVTLHFDGDIAEPWEMNDLSIEKSRSISINFKRNKIRFSGRKLLSITEGYPSSFRVTVLKDEQVLLTQIFDIQILAPNQWLGINYQPKLISSFSVPNHPRVISIIQKASQILNEWGVSFSDYQTDDRTDVKAQIKAIYMVLQQQNISYVTSPPSFETSGQRVRLGNEVLEQGMGNCIELALLFSACLEYVQLNPIIVFIAGHAFVGCWLVDHSFPYAVNDDISSLKIRLAKGMEDIIVFETLSLAGAQPVLFEEAIKKGNQNIETEEDYLYTLDIKKTRLLGVRPMPQENETLQIEQGHLDTDTADEPLFSDNQMPGEVETMEEVEVVTKRKRSRLKTWESKLLNLTLRNNLLNFRPHRRSISIMEGDLDLLEDDLSTGREFALIPCPEEMDGENRSKKEYSYTLLPKEAYCHYMNQELKSNRLVTLMNAKDLAFSVNALYHASRTELEENGANTLYLAIGFLKWYERDISKQARFAPILLYPIELIRKSAVKGYVIRFRDEEIQLNLTLLEKLRMELNIEIPYLDSLPEDEKGIDVQKVLNIFRSAIKDKPNWDVVDRSYISLFSFNEFVMWNDLHTRGEEIIENPIISGLISGTYVDEGKDIIPVHQIDKMDFTDKSAVLMDADSSQLSAIYSSVKGSSFVLHGPPGTGKSQTITNIIASALYQGKSVLFVAEKMAALNVVQTRLEKVGLENFVLELHSNKARKSTVLEHLGKTLNIRANGTVKDMEDKRSQLMQQRAQLRNTNEALHQKLENGLSIFDLIATYESLSRYKLERVEKEALNRVSKQFFEEIEDAVHAYTLSYEKLKDIKNHPLKRIQLKQITFKQREELRESIDAFINLLKNGMEALEKTSLCRWTHLHSYSNLLLLLETMETVISNDGVFKQPITNINSEQIDTAIFDIIAKGKGCEKTKEALLADFDESILTFDANASLLEWQQAEQKWFLPKLLNQNAILKKIKPYAKNSKNITKDQLQNVLTKIKSRFNALLEIDDYMGLQPGKYQEHWKGQQTNWDTFSNALEQTETVMKKILDTAAKIEDFKADDFVNEIYNHFAMYLNTKESIGALRTLIHQLEDGRLKLDAAIHSAILDTSKPLNDELNALVQLQQSYGEIDRWVDYVSCRQWFSAQGLISFVQGVENADISVDDLEGRIKRSLSYYSAIEELDQNQALRNFKSTSMEILIQKYKKDLQLTTKMTELDLIARLTAKIPTQTLNVNGNSELGLLKKAVKNGGRGISLRKVFDSTPNIIRSLAPCMLMSPMSIAQYIDPSFPKFDLVIFDEASQVYTHTAVGAISRGQQLIVVGDPNQLPPTSFFKGNYEDEEEDFEQMDQDSILDECQTVSFPELHLNWHYRSRHESLIAFSNSQYYHNSLYTFPSVNDQVSKVTLVPVEGFYDRADTKENLAEAAQIIEEIKRRLQNKELRKKSIGVVTFSSIQQRLIQNMLDELFMKSPKLEAYAAEAAEEIFVKNLENVQGDERDIILFSIGYGPDKNGKVTMNFGPLNQNSGWKRLNVVISRSREEMIVYSVLQPEDIDLSRTSAKGVLGLKRFLEFAKNRNSLSVDIQNTLMIEDGIVDSITHVLERKGYKTHKNVGRSNYRVNIGILDPENENSYIAAIIVDGVTYSNTPTVRDRSVVQPAVLEQLGWNMIFVWTLDWFKNKELVLEQIEEQIVAFKALKATALQLQEQEQIAALEALQEMEIEIIPPPQRITHYYQKHELPQDIHNKALFFETHYLLKAAKYMEDVINAEAPIVEEDLLRRVLVPFGISQLGSRIRDGLEKCTSNINAYRVLDDHETVYWKSQEQEEGYEIYRVPKEESGLAERRTFKYICDKEIENAIIDILQQQVSLDFPNICKETFKLFGYQALGEEAKNKVSLCLSRLLENNKIIQENDRFLSTRQLR